MTRLDRHDAECSPVAVIRADRGEVVPAALLMPMGLLMLTPPNEQQRRVALHKLYKPMQRGYTKLCQRAISWQLLPPYARLWATSLLPRWCLQLSVGRAPTVHRRPECAAGA